MCSGLEFSRQRKRHSITKRDILCLHVLVPDALCGAVAESADEACGQPSYMHACGHSAMRRHAHQSWLPEKRTVVEQNDNLQNALDQLKAAVAAELA